MQTTTNYGLKKPEGNEFVSIADLNENADKVDEVLKGLDDDKIDSSGGDIANTKVSEFAANSTQWPVPAAGEAPKTLWGKVKKFIEDFKNWMTGVCLIGQIVNNCVTNNPNLPLSAAQGKALMDLYTVLNTKLTGLFVTANLSVGYTLDSWGVADVTLPFSPPGGYSFFCVNRIDTADIRPVALTSYYQSGNNLIVGLCNCSAQSISGTLVATNVYLKSDFWGSL